MNKRIYLCLAHMSGNEHKQVVALSAGTAAVHLALITCGVQAGDEVCETGAM